MSCFWFAFHSFDLICVEYYIQWHPWIAGKSFENEFQPKAYETVDGYFQQARQHRSSSLDQSCQFEEDISKRNRLVPWQVSSNWFLGRSVQTGSFAGQFKLVPWQVNSNWFLGRSVQTGSLAGQFKLVPWQVSSNWFLGRSVQTGSLAGQFKLVPWQVSSNWFLGRSVQTGSLADQFKLVPWQVSSNWFLGRSVHWLDSWSAENRSYHGKYWKDLC